jgi:regulator of cell morphogenesis and NO signaling
MTDQKMTLQRWEVSPVRDVIRFLADVQHAEIRLELLSIRRLITNLANGHSSRQPDRLGPLHRAFGHLAEQLEAHMENQESVLFPAIAEMDQRASVGEPFTMPAFGSVRNPIRMMEQENAEAARTLARIRELTGNYRLRDPDCEMFRVLCQALESFDSGVQSLILLEQKVLFPRAMGLEARLSRS